MLPYYAVHTLYLCKGGYCGLEKCQALTQRIILTYTSAYTNKPYLPAQLLIPVFDNNSRDHNLARDECGFSCVDGCFALSFQGVAFGQLFAFVTHRSERGSVSTLATRIGEGITTGRFVVSVDLAAERMRCSSHT